jgi:hypothetical protein
MRTRVVLRVFECRRVGAALRAFRPLFPGALFITRANGSSRDEERDLGAELHRSHADLAAAVACVVLLGLGFGFGLRLGFGFGSAINPAH